jgi:hypothetical protein
MRNKAGFKFYVILCMVVLALLVLTAWAFAEKKDMVQEWVSAEEGGSVSLGSVTITFDPGVLPKDTKITIIDFGGGVYQFGPDIKVDETFTIYFADAPPDKSEVTTFKQGETITLTCIDGYVETDHFCRYRGCW